MKKVLITGANSYIGTAFERFIAERAAGRYRVDTLDMRAPGWREKDFAGYDAVLHTAGLAHCRETRKNAALFYAVNRDLAVQTAEKAKRAGVRHFIYLSSMSVYGRLTGVITPATKPAPGSHYGKSKWAGEQALAALADEAFRPAFLRLPMVYGKDCPGNFTKLLRHLAYCPVFPQTDNRRSMLYIDNLSALIALILDEERAGVFMPQNREYMNTAQMAQWIRQAQGGQLYASRALGWCARALEPFSETARKALGSLTYQDTETLDFRYCRVDNRESILRSV